MKTDHRLSPRREPSRSKRHPSCLSGREDEAGRICRNSIRVINTSANEEPSCLKHWRCEKAHSHLNTPSQTDEETRRNRLINLAISSALKPVCSFYSNCIDSSPEIDGIAVALKLIISNSS